MNEQQKEIRRQRAKAWNQANPERAKENARRWREKNREELRARGRDYYDRNTTACQDAQRRFNERKPWYFAWIGARQRCTNPKIPHWKYYGGKGIKCLLTQDEVAMLWQRDNAATLKRPSIDRIDSDKDYTVENCRFIELSENSKKARIDGAARRSTATHAGANQPGVRNCQANVRS